MKSYVTYILPDGQEFASFQEANQYLHRKVKAYIADKYGDSYIQLMEKLPSYAQADLRKRMSIECLGADWEYSKWGAIPGTKRTTWVAFDGSEFETQPEARAHENELLNNLLDTKINVREFVTYCLQDDVMHFDGLRLLLAKFIENGGKGELVEGPIFN